MHYFCSFTSGSKGNSSIYVKGDTKILIDAGTNAKYIRSCLAQLGLDAKDLTHIVLTHAHNDHVSALRVLMKHTNARLVCTEGTYNQLGIEAEDPLLFWEGESFVLGDVPVASAPTPHDCFGSCCYTLGEEEEKLGFCTDLGYVTDEIYGLLKGCRTLFIESNHDIDMVRNGPYPYFLKQRVLSDKGHLSNTACAEAVAKLACEGTERVMLGHLSETNNRPELALYETSDALSKCGAEAAVLLGAAAAKHMQAPVRL